jgi:hypothetical protein
VVSTVAEQASRSEDGREVSTVRTWPGHFSIVQGQVYEIGPWQGSFSHPSLEGEAVDLYVLAEPALPGSEEFCGQLVEVVGRLYQRESLSLTGGLLRSLRAAHEHLREWNRKSLREHQVGVGASCVAVRGQLAYLAQAGPSLAYHLGGDRLRRVTPLTNEAAVPIGSDGEFLPELSRYELEPGDLLLLASPRLASLVDDEVVAGILGRGVDDLLPELFRLTRDLPDFSVYLLACYEAPEEPAAVPTPEEPAAAEDSPSEPVASTPPSSPDAPGPSFPDEPHAP